jgi:hypothetical protein
MSTEDQPHWLPIPALPLISGMIRGRLADGREPDQLLAQACPMLHVRDDPTVGRVAAVFGTQKGRRPS